MSGDTTTVNNIPLNGTFSTAEPSFDGASTGTTYLLWSDILGSAEDVVTTLTAVGASDALYEEDDTKDTFGEELSPAEAGVDVEITGFGRDVTADSSAELCPQYEPVFTDLVYGEFESEALITLYEDLCTAKLEEINIGLLGQETFDDPDAECGPAASRAFAHYAAGAIAGFINNLEFTIEQTAPTTAAAVVLSTTVATAGSAAAQTGTGTGTVDITSFIEDTAITITIGTKS